MVIDGESLTVDLVLNRGEVLLEGLLAQEKDVVAWLTFRFVLEVVVVR